MSSATEQLDDILSVLAKQPNGLSRSDLLNSLKNSIHYKTLQRRLNTLIEKGKVFKLGEKKATRYFPATSTDQETERYIKRHIKDRHFNTKNHAFIRSLSQQAHAVPYNQDLLASYFPNESFLVAEDIRQQLLVLGKQRPALTEEGSHARQIFPRFVIEFAFHTCRLDGDTTTENDIKDLLQLGTIGKHVSHRETLEILNHREAVNFMVHHCQDLALNSLTIRNMHHLLSQELLNHQGSEGKVRTGELLSPPEKFTPVNDALVLKKLLEQVAHKARKIKHPIEQSFFLLAQLSYLQPFEHFNNSTARLCCNLPLMKENICPVHFADISENDYNSALAVLFQTANPEPLLEVYCWAMKSSSQTFSTEPEPDVDTDNLRILLRECRKAVLQHIVNHNLHGKQTEKYIRNFCFQHGISQRDFFIEEVNRDLQGLHAGAIMELGISVKDLDSWRLKEGG